MKIVADAHIPFLRGVFEPWAQVDYIPGREIGRRHLTNAGALIIRTRTQADRHLLENTDVRIVASATIGTDHIDLDWCRENGITVVNAPGCNAGSVMQYVASALVWLARRKKFRFTEKTLGIIGVGNVGSKVERLAKALGFSVLLNDPPRERKEGSGHFVSLEKLLDKSDIVTLHVPLNKTGADKTLGMVNETFLSRMKCGSVLINTSRGPVVQDNALLEALRSEHLTSAVLDVWNNEPAINRDLLERVSLATPHIAGYSVDGKANGTAMSVNAVSRFFHLPLEPWYPEELPPPGNPVIHINNEKMNLQECLTEAILHTYSIRQDDNHLRKDPAAFELLRGKYPVRREFFNYKIVLKKPDKVLEKHFLEIGFNINN
ncbi:MAG: 4-phosphoerythronate dehydrogenase [Chlorobi bacterium]|nr:4-phosphoerythronate dehydrogenase [Chlorobiota bacterium]